MAFFTKLSNVTEAIKELIRQNLIARFGETSLTFAVTAAPPESSASPTPTISVYLFHLIEDPFRKNAPPVVGTGSVPVRHAPMGLSLFYVITVLSEASSEDDTNATRQQELLGYAAKTIHDFPVISESTKIDGTPIFEPTMLLEGNTVELILRPVKIEETITFWSTQEARTPKLALFVEARVVLLEPERPETSAGIVLSVGQFIFPSGAPHIAQTKSTVAFFPPGANPAVDEARTITAVPARITILSNVPAPVPEELEDNNLLTIEGSGFSGFRRTLTLRVRGTTLRVNMDDDTQNDDWDFERGASIITLRFRDTVVDVEGTTHALTPGVYTARISVSEQLSGPLVPRSTNEVAFTVSPQIIAVTEASALWTVTISGDYLDPDLVEIQLAVGGIVLERVDTLPPSGDAYRVVDGSTLEFQLANPPGVNEFQVVQLSVNGTIAPPWWIEEPGP